MAIKRKWFTDFNGDEISESEYLSKVRSMMSSQGYEVPGYINTSEAFGEWFSTLSKSVGTSESKSGVKGLSDEIKNGEGSFWGGLRNIWNKITGNDLTDADKAANDFNSEQAAIQRSWQEKMYQQYESPAAQISSQMEGFRSNGINPALMYGGTAPSGGSVGSGSSASSVSPSSDSFNLLSLMMSIPTMISNLKTNVAQRNLIDAQARNVNATTHKVESETTGIDIANYVAEATKDLKIFAASLSNDKTAAEISNIFKGMELTDSQILVNGKQIDYLSSMVDLNSALADKTESEIALNAQRILESQQNIKLMTSQIHLNNANASQIRALTPHLEALYEAQANLYDAESLTELREAENLVARTAKTVVETAVSQKLLDSDYYDNVIKKTSFETSSAESQTHIDAVAAENAWNMLFAEFFQKMTDGVGNLLMPKAVSDASKRSADARAASGKGETTTTTIKEHRFDKQRDTRTTTRTIRR